VSWKLEQAPDHGDYRVVAEGSKLDEKRASERRSSVRMHRTHRTIECCTQMTAFVPVSSTSVKRRPHFSCPCRARQLPSGSTWCTSFDAPATVRSLLPSHQSSLLVAETSVTATIPPPAGAVFEPVPPDVTALAGFGIIVILSVAAAWVWANQVVPVSRTKLAISKKSGAVRDYLDGLKQDEEQEAKVVAANATSDSFSATTNDAGTTGISGSGDGRDFERWLVADWLRKDSTRKAGRQKEPAIPVLRDAKWNSGDNPVLAASALIGLGVVATAVAERIASAFSN